MKHPTFRGLLRLAAFLLGLALIVAFANTFCIKTDIYAALTMAEVKARSDIEVAFVGSSIVRDHFNAEMISKEIGKTCFALGIPCGMLQGNIASTRELYRKNSPEWTILVIEPFTVDSAREGIEGQYDLLPFLSSPFEQLRYYYSVAKEDGWYVDRAFMFRDYAVDSFGEFMETVGMHLRPFRTYEKIRPTLDPRMTYMGSGYSRCDTDERATEMVRQQIIREYTGYVYDLLPQTREMLLEYRDLVAQKGSKLLVFIYPNMTAHNLAIPGFLDYADALTRFCGENDMPCVNFSYAKPELYPRETDQYYFDLYHMVGEGADIFSASFCKFFKAYLAGEDTSDWFYADRWAYFSSVSFITNCWIQTYFPEGEWNGAWEQSRQAVAAASENGARDVYAANCNHGPSVAPEYRFFLRDEATGAETPLTDWQAEGILACDKGTLTGQCIRVYARAQGGADDPSLYFDFRPGIDEEPCLQV